MKINTYNQQTTTMVQGNIAPVQAIPITDPSAVAEGNLGQSVGQIAGAMGDASVTKQSHLAQQAYESSLATAANTGSQAQLDWTAKFQAAQQGATGAATGFTENFLKDFDAGTKDTLDAYKDPVSKNLLKHEFSQLRTSLGMQGLQFQQKMFDENKKNNIDGFVKNNTALILQDPKQYNTMIAKTQAIVDNSGLGEFEKQKVLDEANKTYRYSAANSMVQNNPEKLLSALKGSTGDFPAGSVQQQIVKADPSNALYNLAVMGVESGYKTDIKASKSTASGLAQFTDATKKQYGLTDKSTLEQQVAALGSLTADNKKALTKRLGRAPTYDELYLAHHFGAAGSARIISASSETPISSVVSAKSMEQNPYLKGKTVGEVRAINSEKFNNYSLVADMDAKEKIHYINQAQAAVDTIAAVKATNLQSTIDNQIAMASQGNMSFRPLSESDIATMYPKDPQKATDVYQKYNTAIQTGQAVARVNVLSPEDEAKLLSERMPNDPNNYANQLHGYSTLQKAIHLKHEAIQKDPVGWSMSNSPTVQSAFGKINGIVDPQQKAQAQDYAYSTLVAEQSRQGVAYPKIVSKTEEDGLIAKLQNTKGSQKAQLINQMAGQYGRYWGTVAGQLQNNTSMPEGLAAIMSAPQGSAIERASILADVSLESLKKALPSDKKGSDVDTAVSSALDNFKKSFPTSALGSKNVNDIMKNVEKAAYDNARNMDPADAAISAVNQFLGSTKYNYIDNNGDMKVRVPQQYDAPTVKKSLITRLGALSEADINTEQAKLFVNPWTLLPTAGGYLKHVKDTGYWLTNSDETKVGLYYVDSNNVTLPVLGKDGKQITQPFNQIGK